MLFCDGTSLSLGSLAFPYLKRARLAQGSPRLSLLALNILPACASTPTPCPTSTLYLTFMQFSEAEYVAHQIVLEEERWLFYVGVTRTQKKLVLAHTKTRFLLGQKCKNEPSRFLNDIEQALKEVKQMASRKPDREKEETTQFKLF